MSPDKVIDPTRVADLNALIQEIIIDFEESEEVDAKQREQAAIMGAPQCGPAQGSSFVSWSREAADHIRSLALVPLGQTSVFGLLALGSEDPKRFYADMGTLYLRRIGELCAAGVSARL